MSIEIKGAKELIKRYGVRMLEKLEPAVTRGRLRNQRDMAHYPPQRSGSSYVRTGKLGQAWTGKTYNTGDALFGVTGNKMHYAPDVQSRARQRDIFRGRWQTEVDVMEKNRKDIVDDIQRTALEALK